IRRTLPDHRSACARHQDARSRAGRGDGDQRAVLYRQRATLQEGVEADRLRCGFGIELAPKPGISNWPALAVVPEARHRLLVPVDAATWPVRDVQMAVRDDEGLC